jgi:hypothetical protein
MDATARERLFEALHTTAAWPDSGGDTLAVAELADLVVLTALVEQLNEQARAHLAPRPTVTSHLRQAQEHLAGLRRNLTHAPRPSLTTPRSTPRWPRCGELSRRVMENRRRGCEATAPDRSDPKEPQ